MTLKLVAVDTDTDATELALERLGYRKWCRDEDEPHKTLFQKKESSLGGQRFLNVWRWDWKNYQDSGQIPVSNDRYTYEIEETFETKLGKAWVSTKVYSMDGGELLAMLDDIEKALTASFFALRGRYRE